MKIVIVILFAITVFVGGYMTFDKMYHTKKQRVRKVQKTEQKAEASKPAEPVKPAPVTEQTNAAASAQTTAENPPEKKTTVKKVPKKKKKKKKTSAAKTQQSHQSPAQQKNAAPKNQPAAIDLSDYTFTESSESESAADPVTPVVVSSRTDNSTEDVSFEGNTKSKIKSARTSKIKHRLTCCGGVRVRVRPSLPPPHPGSRAPFKKYPRRQKPPVSASGASSVKNPQRQPPPRDRKYNNTGNN